MTRTADLTGQRFTRLVIVSPAQGANGARWNCVCDCGQTVTVFGANLRKGHAKSCGCLRRELAVAKPRRTIGLTGQRFTRLVVLSRSGSDHRGEARWECQCDCGRTITILGSSLRSGASKSCGCLTRSTFGETRVTHGMSATPEYSVWQQMHARCTNPHNKMYHRYGERGINVCERWNDFSCFYADMGPRPSTSHTIERIDNNAGYEPSNCKWLPWREQHFNKSTTRYVSYEGARMSLMQAVIRSTAGANYGCVKQRLRKGWTVEKALSTPPDQKIWAKRRLNQRLRQRHSP